ncbi:MAG: hypothetical protein HC879_22850 [Leptolyngbyaceae cyanobacterium SL_5_9]|nr:hypothetical protein [Leptolyngbyaceae cyanobacterium SL_5_9]
MEPLTATVIATLIATKAFEKTGDKLGDSVWALVSKFLNALRRKDQATAAAIEMVAKNPELAEQQPKDYGVATLVTKVEAAAQEDAEVRQAAQEISIAAKAQHPTMINNFTKLLEKGILIQGGQNDFRGAKFTF